MLALTFTEGDYVLIGDDIRVYFKHKVTRDSMLVGIEAPKDKKIFRSKLYVEHLTEKAKDGDDEAKAYAEQMRKEQAKIRRDNIGRRVRRDAVEKRTEANRLKALKKEGQSC